MSHYLLSHFEVQMYDQNERKFNGVYSRNNLWGICNESS